MRYATSQATVRWWDVHVYNDDGEDGRQAQEPNLPNTLDPRRGARTKNPKRPRCDRSRQGGRRILLWRRPMEENNAGERNPMSVRPSPPPPSLALRACCPTVPSHVLGIFSTHQGSGVVPRRGRRGTNGIDRDAVQMGLNRTPIFLWAGILSRCERSTGIWPWSRPGTG
jgi:hypothetical protein